jgi:hypothetical protein
MVNATANPSVVATSTSLPPCRQPDHHRLGDPVEDRSEHDRERRAARLIAVCILAFAAPKAIDQPMISPIARKLMRNRSATRAPITSEELARVPQPNAPAI